MAAVATNDAAATAVYHVPVMLRESVDALAVRDGGVYVDVTMGGGGHTREILSRLTGGARLYSFDVDGDAERNAPPEGATFTFVRSNFRYLRNWMRYYGESRLDGIIADLGVSWHHFDDAARGFSFRHDAPLDMRMNRSARHTAADILATYMAERLADVIYTYGELRQARRIAAAIVEARTVAPVDTTGRLLAVTEPWLGRGRRDAAQLFQALRIEVNGEMTALSEMLAAAVDLLGTGGRLVVITYHSLEDRMVKNVMRTGNTAGHRKQDFFGRIAAPLRPVGSRIVTPSTQEQESNPRSRSAKMRVAEKI